MNVTRAQLHAMQASLTLWVPGVPIAQGSMRSPKAGIVLHNSPDLKEWRENIGWAAKDVWRGKPLLDCPVELSCIFQFEAPKKPRHERWRDTSPDLDKLLRAVGDALEGVVLKNDSRIASVTCSKKWGVPGVYIHLEVLT